MAHTTEMAARIIAAARATGCRDYNVMAGNFATKKMTRLLLPNGNPIAINNLDKSPRVWMRAVDERGSFSAIGVSEIYEEDRPRSSNLGQVREFRNARLIKVALRDVDIHELRRAFEAAGRGYSEET